MRSRVAQVACWMVATAALAAGAVFLEERLGLVIAVALVLSASGPAIVRLRNDPYHAGGLAVLFTAATLGLTSLAWLGSPDLAGPGLTVDDVRKALLLVAAGTLALTAGVALIPTRGRPTRGRLSREHLPAWCYASLFAIGTVVTVAGLAAGKFGYGAETGTATASAIATVAHTTAFVVLALALACFSGAGRRHERLLVVLIGCQVVLGFLGGTKGDAVIPLVLIVVASVLYGRRVPLRAVTVIALGLFLILIPANRAMRQAIADEGRSPTVIAEAILDLDVYRPDRAVTESLNYVLTRYRQIDSVALIQRDTPGLYAWGDQSLYLRLPLILVLPRSVWRDKPILDLGQQFSHTYWELPTDIRTSTPLTQIGDLVRNFGPVGLIALVGWGTLLSLAARFWRQHRSPRTDLVYLAFLAYLATYVESDLPTAIAMAGRTLPLAIAIAWVTLPGLSTGSRPGAQLLPSMLGRLTPRPQSP